MDWITLAGSLVGVLMLTGIAWGLGLGRIKAITRTEAADMAELRLIAFQARDAWVSDDGAGALVLGDGEAALIKRHGADYALRRLPLPLKLHQEGDVVAVETDEILYGSVRLMLPQPMRDKLFASV